MEKQDSPRQVPQALSSPESNTDSDYYEEDKKFDGFEDSSMGIPEITLTSDKVRSTSEMRNHKCSVFGTPSKL